MKKIILLVSILFVMQSVVTAQQEQSVFTHYQVNPVLINPAAAGFSGSHELFANFKNQWTDFPGAAKTYALSYNGPVAKTFGLGATIYKENVASLDRLRAVVNYAFRYKVDKLKFGFGFTTEYSQWSINNNVLTNDLYDPGDEIIEEGIEGINSFDASLGLYGLYNEKTYIGIAFPNIIMARLDGSEGPDIDELDDGGFYMFNVGHKIDVAEGFQLEPSLLLRKVRNVPFTADLSLRGLFMEERLVGGLTYRTGIGESLIVLIGTKQEQFSFYYSFDVSFQDFQTFNNGAHELTVGFRIPAKDRSSVQNGTIEQLVK